MEQHAGDAPTIDATEASLFDAEWYLESNPDIAAVGIDPFLHFIRFGAAELRQPNRYFDGRWYLSNNPDVAEQGLDPFLHYFHRGDREGRGPHRYFDAGWYRAVHGLSADQPALAHFLTERRTGRHTPCADLWVVPFLAAYRDDPALGVDPFGHYLDDMATRGDCFGDIEIVRNSGLVDAAYYNCNASHAREAEWDPVTHYCRFGWRERRKPNIHFDPVWYRGATPELAVLRVDPLLHYILVGEPGNRRPNPDFDPAWYRATYGVPDGQMALAHYLTHRRSNAVSPNAEFHRRGYVGGHPPMRIAAITMVYNEGAQLRRWLRHYGRQFGANNLLVLDHGSDDGSTDDLGGAGRITLPRVEYDNNQRSGFINEQQHSLFRYYDGVVYTDCDELIVADPRKYSGLVDYFGRMRNDCARPVGLELFQDEIPGKGLMEDVPLSLQRQYCRFVVGMCKPLLARAPVQWIPGFHSCDKRVPIDPSLFLFHTKYADYAAALARQAVTRGLPWSERSLKGSQGRHQRREDEQMIKDNFQGPIDRLRQEGCRDFAFEDVVDQFYSKLTYQEPRVWHASGWRGHLYKVPDWLHGTF